MTAVHVAASSAAATVLVGFAIWKFSLDAPSQELQAGLVVVLAAVLHDVGSVVTRLVNAWLPRLEPRQQPLQLRQQHGAGD